MIELTNTEAAIVELVKCIEKMQVAQGWGTPTAVRLHEISTSLQELAGTLVVQRILAESKKLN